MDCTLNTGTMMGISGTDINHWTIIRCNRVTGMFWLSLRLCIWKNLKQIDSQCGFLLLMLTFSSKLKNNNVIQYDMFWCMLLNFFLLNKVTRTDVLGPTCVQRVMILSMAAHSPLLTRMYWTYVWCCMQIVNSHPVSLKVAWKGQVD